MKKPEIYALLAIGLLLLTGVFYLLARDFHTLNEALFNTEPAVEQIDE